MKSTVSTGLPVDHLPVERHGRGGDRGPGEPLADPGEAACRHARPRRFVVEQRAERGGEFLRRRQAVTSSAASPVTSGSAPARLAISGVPDAMCSTAGSENPSYMDGITATSAEASTRAYSSSGRPLANVTRSPRASCAACFLVAGEGVPTTTGGRRAR